MGRPTRNHIMAIVSTFLILCVLTECMPISSASAAGPSSTAFKGKDELRDTNFGKSETIQSTTTVLPIPNTHLWNTEKSEEIGFMTIKPGVLMDQTPGDLIYRHRERRSRRARKRNRKKRRGRKKRRKRNKKKNNGKSKTEPVTQKPNGRSTNIEVAKEETIQDSTVDRSTLANISNVDVDLVTQEPRTNVANEDQKETHSNVETYSVAQEPNKPSVQLSKGNLEEKNSKVETDFVTQETNEPSVEVEKDNLEETDSKVEIDSKESNEPSVEVEKNNLKETDSKVEIDSKEPNEPSVEVEKNNLEEKHSKVEINPAVQESTESNIKVDEDRPDQTTQDDCPSGTIKGDLIYRHRERRSRRARKRNRKKRRGKKSRKRKRQKRRGRKMRKQNKKKNVCVPITLANQDEINHGYDICNDPDHYPCVRANTEICEVTDDGFWCQCKKEFMGTTCDRNRDACTANYNSKNPSGVEACGVHGQCNPVLGSNLYGCTCSEGYTDEPSNSWPDCQLREDICKTTLCINGLCRASEDMSKAVCVCDDGFWGPECSERTLVPSWDSWGPWSACQPECGNPRSRERLRTCNIADDQCVGNPEDFQACAASICKTDGTFWNNPQEYSCSLQLYA